MRTQCDNLQLQGCDSTNEMPLGPDRANAEFQQQHTPVVMHKDTETGICSIADVVEVQLHFCM